MHGMRGVSSYRTVWISDLHLGTRGCKADYLLDFLKHVQCDTLYLVGDIVDGWRLKRSWYWPQPFNDVVQKMLRKARKGTRIVVYDWRCEARVVSEREPRLAGASFPTGPQRGVHSVGKAGPPGCVYQTCGDSVHSCVGIAPDGRGEQS